ncbi:hypothetical protein [Williamsia maris]|uniref:hypothetical protein n=1 Tax=Williamsia maris TaxID=72806 RepID=UPI0020A618E8|nr:hypothetical protein [Williamsia maris]
MSTGAFITVGGFHGFALDLRSPDSAPVSSETTDEDYLSVSENIIVSIAVDDPPLSQSVDTDDPNSPVTGYPPGLWAVYEPLRPELVEDEDHMDDSD